MTAAVFVDTSALYAVLDVDDAMHAEAGTTFDELLSAIADHRAQAITHSGIVVESAALVQRRLGMGPVRALLVDIVPLLDVVWIDAALHARATTALLAAGRGSVSLVDWTSFELMRTAAISVAFAFDEDFTSQGFTTIEPGGV